MTKSLSKNTGFTFLEMAIAILILSFIIGSISMLIVPGLTYFRHSQVRQQASLEARQCMDTITHLLSLARPGTISISTPTDGPPNSMIQFSDAKSVQYTITWSASPLNTIQEITGGKTSIIGHNITGLMFTGDFRDLSIVNVSLQIDVLFDTSGREGSVFTLLMPSRAVHLTQTQ